MPVVSTLNLDHVALAQRPRRSIRTSGDAANAIHPRLSQEIIYSACGDASAGLGLLARGNRSGVVRERRD